MYYKMYHHTGYEKYENVKLIGTFLPTKITKKT